MKYLAITLSLVTVLGFTSCSDDENLSPSQQEMPTTYEFTRNGESTVSYSGQTTRLDMLSEIKTYLRTADAGEEISSQVLLDMFANENGPFSSDDLNNADKQLENKTFISDVEFFKDLFADAAAASADYAANETVAEAGASGRIERGTSGSFILVNDKGWEFTQITEKGLMGATFLNQIFNSYLTDAKIGADVENEELVEGKNYTTKEHHWDEAFGYWGVNEAFDSEGENRFWGNYTFGRESYLGSATTLKEAFLKGRTAIVNDDQTTLDEQRDIIYSEFERIAAATAVHYINEAIADLNGADQGSAFHHLSEGYGFVMALKYSPYKEISSAQIDEILNTHFGTDGDFWEVSIESLQKAKGILVDVYSDFADIADEL